jgi:hypothetical protein
MTALRDPVRVGSHLACDPGAPRFALCPGYYMSRLRREGLIQS